MTENLREGHFFRVLKDKATDTWDRLSFWTKARDVEFSDGRNLEERLPFDFAIDSKGNYGYKKKGADTVTPFRNPVGDAIAADVLQGKVFSNAYSDNVTGSMPNRGDISKTLNPGDSTNIPKGYYSGGKITANRNTGTYTFGSSNGATVDMGASNLNRYVNASNVYNKGYSDGYGIGQTDGYNSGQAAGVTNAGRFVRVAEIKYNKDTDAYTHTAYAYDTLSGVVTVNYGQVSIPITDTNGVSLGTETYNRGIIITGFPIPITGQSSSLSRERFFIVPYPRQQYSSIFTGGIDGDFAYMISTLLDYDVNTGTVKCICCYGATMSNGDTNRIPMSFDLYVYTGQIENARPEILPVPVVPDP